MSLSIEDAKSAEADAQDDQLRDTPAGISDENAIDWDNEEVVSEVNLSPEALISFSHISRISIETYGVEDNILDLEQNMQGAGKYGFDVNLTLADPTIEQGQMWEETDAEYPDRRIVGDPEADTNPYELRENVVRDDDGDIQDVETEGLGNLPGGNSFDAEEVELDADHVTVSVSDSRAIGVLGVLDTAGRWFRTREGEVTEGLFETPPNFGTEQYDSDADGYPRLVGYPQLRADMDGQRGALLCKFNTDDATEADTRTAIELSLFKITDDGEFTPLSALSPSDENYYKPQYPRLGNTYWDAETDDDFGSDAEPEANGGVAEAKAMMDDSSDETTFDDLNDTAQEFVEDAVDALSGEYDTVSELDDWDDRYAQFAADIDASQSDVASIIDGRL